MSVLCYPILMSHLSAYKQFNNTLVKVTKRIDSLAKVMDTTDVNKAYKLRNELHTYIINHLITNVEGYSKQQIQELLGILKGVDEDWSF